MPLCQLGVLQPCERDCCESGPHGPGFWCVFGFAVFDIFPAAALRLPSFFGWATCDGG